MSKKIFFILSFLIIYILNFDALLSMKQHSITKSPKFRTSETLESFIENKVCWICGLPTKEKDSIECLNCKNRIHISCADKINRKFGINLFLDCLYCSKN